MPNYTPFTTFLQENLDLVTVILESAALSNLDSLSNSVVQILAYTNKVVPFIKKQINSEIQMNDTAATIFRPSAISSQLIGSYFELVGKKWARATILTPLSKIVQQNKSFEVITRIL